MEIKHDVSLKKYNTFGIDAYAKYYAEINNESDFYEVFGSQLYIQNKVMILGGGSNVLFVNDIDALVLKVSIKGIQLLSENEDTVIIEAGAGEIWHDFVTYCIVNGYGGVENLSLIPGTVGAAPMQNIGAYGAEIKDVFYSLQAINLQTCDKHTFYHADCEFGYRESVFKGKYKNQFLITNVAFKLHKKHVLNTRYGAILDTLQQKNITLPTIKDVSDAVIAIRKSKLPDPELIGNAGSFFKNPVIKSDIAAKLLETYPQMPNYPEPNGNIKIAAGWLIEQCGYKGTRVGDAGVHHLQALVLVNHGQAKGKDIWELAMHIKDGVKNKFGIEIIPEVNII
ncbi:MAG: UDP-N-acetylmuramate dehydrogenase [Cytophagales bacterium]|nr:UDP-N-acetylmuramate dehydrogenase [Cytophagales bacterium]